MQFDLYFFVEPETQRGRPPTVKIFIKNKLKSKLQEDTYRGELGCKTERKKRSRKALCTVGEVITDGCVFVQYYTN